MRVGIDILSEIAGLSSGTETFLTALLPALLRANGGKHEFFLFVNRGNERFYRRHAGPFKRVPFPFSSRHQGLRVLSQLLLIPYKARRLDLDVVNFLGTTGAFFVGCATVQHVKTLHHIEAPEGVGRRAAVFRRLMMGPSARSADLVIANTQATAARAARYLGVPRDRITVVPEAVNHEIFFPRLDGDRYQRTLDRYAVVEPYILFVSSLWPYKNVDGLIAAYARLLRNHHLPHALVIVGGLSRSRYCLHLRHLVRELGVSDRVNFVGHIVDRREIRDLYVGAELYVNPSYAETFGLTVLEAMACAVPVVASNRTALPEVAGGAALLVDPSDEAALAEGMAQVLLDSGLRARLVASGIKRAREFTWERTARETLRAYERALELRGNHGGC